jgi:uncharacterized phiE125 gp8 family phage protein
MPVTLPEAKLHCKVEINDDDALIVDLINTATKHVERITGWLTTSQTIQKSYSLISPKIILPYWPVTAVTAIEIVGATTSNVASSFDVDLTERPARLVLYDLLTLGRGDRLRVTYTAGSTTHPVELHHAVIQLVGHWYENRGDDMTTVPPSVDRILSQFVGLRLS